MLQSLCLFSVWVHKQEFIPHTASQHHITVLKHLQLHEKEEIQYLFWSRKPTPNWMFFTRRIPDNHAEQAIPNQVNPLETGSSISITTHALIADFFLHPHIKACLPLCHHRLLWFSMVRTKGMCTGKEGWPCWDKKVINSFFSRNLQTLLLY